MVRQSFIVFFLIFLTIKVDSEPLSLEESIKIALKNNLSVRMAEQKLRIAKGKLNETMSAARPKLSLDGGYTKIGPVPSLEFQMPTMTIQIPGFPPGTISAPPSKIDIVKEYTYDVKLSLQQMLYTWGKIEEGIRQAELYLQGSQYEFDKTKQEVEFSVKKAYYGVLQAQAFERVAREAVNQVEAHLKVANSLFEAGIVPKFDVLRAEVQLANVNQNLIAAKNAVQLAKAAFNSTLGVDLDSPVELVELKHQEPFEPVEVDLKEILETAYKYRPEISQLEIAIEQQKGLIDLAIAGSKPTLMLIGNYNWKTETAMTLPRTWNAVLALSFPIFDGGATPAKIEQAKFGLEQAKTSLEQLKQGIALEVRQAFLSLKESEERIKAAAKNVEQAKESLRLAEVRYKEGVSPSIELTDAQVALTQAETNYVQALYDYELAKAKIEKAMGKPLAR